MLPLISVVVPAYNEQEVLEEFHRRLSAVMSDLPFRWEVVYVNDGSKDDTLSVLRTMRDRQKEVAIVDLSRNFGKEIAMTAGIDHAHGDAVVVIDADLQDPPELIPALVQGWAEEGYDTVYAQRSKREGETGFKRLSAHLFYRVMERATRIPIPRDTGDFRLMSRRAVDALCKLREQHRFMKGLFAWIGFSQKAVPYRRDRRYAGQTKWNYWQLWNLAIEGITSFTVVPLKLSSYLGLLVSLSAFLYALVIVYKTLMYGDPVAGYPSLMVTVLFIGGINLMVLGFIGEYLGRVFNETKSRPLYLIQAFEPSAEYGVKPAAMDNTTGKSGSTRGSAVTDHPPVSESST